jgi:hypothetical protein
VNRRPGPHDDYPGGIDPRFGEQTSFEVLHDASCSSATRICAWCEGPIPPGARSDAKHCATRCRQAAHRFKRGMHLVAATDRPLRLAYADPPYPGRARRYYADHPDFDGEVDQGELIARLEASYDGWALSTSADALPDVLAHCPAGVRVGAWFRGERPTRSLRPLNAWEPVIFHGGRAYASTIEARRLDALVGVPGVRTTETRRVVGTKPGVFCWWLFDLLGALPGDHFTDLFPGSGGVTRAWGFYTSDGQRRRECSE